MINRFDFGTPIETEAVVENIICDDIAQMYGRITVLKDNSILVRLADEDIVYGLGETVRGINKRSWIYESNCSDDSKHTDGKHSLYAAHNFLMVSGKDTFGMFFDTPSKVSFDIGYTKYDEMKITVASGSFKLYVLEPESNNLGTNAEKSVIAQFRRIIGKSYVAPKWAFGYGQSRWGYKTAEDVREVAKMHRENNIPLDAIYLDIDYMDNYKDFTVDTNKFPDFEGLVKEMKSQNIHLVPIIDAGIKKEDGYSVYEEGKEKGYYCKDENGEDFVVGVWPGDCVLTDMLNDDARAWFGDKYKALLDMGIDGFWNDMNEPALFYSRKNLNDVLEKVSEKRGRNMSLDEYFEFLFMLGGISNRKEDYESFYHNYKGKTYRHDEVHNLFGYYMTRSAAESFKRNVPDKNILMFSRASYIGMHRYAGVWQGDNRSWWSHILLNLKMMPSLNMCGFLYTGADLGGFGDDTTEDLMIRWLSFALFTPLMRNHSELRSRYQEVYRFEKVDMMKSLIGLRYQLIPYLYDSYLKAAEENSLMFTPLGIEFPKDEIARHVEDQLFVGEDIMIAPVYEQNAIGRTVYFPEKMKMMRIRANEVIEEKEYDKGHFFIEMKLGDVCIFVREGKTFTLGKVCQSVMELQDEGR